MDDNFFTDLLVNGNVGAKMTIAFGALLLIVGVNGITEKLLTTLRSKINNRVLKKHTAQAEAQVQNIKKVRYKKYNRIYLCLRFIYLKRLNLLYSELESKGQTPYIDKDAFKIKKSSHVLCDSDDMFYQKQGFFKDIKTVYQFEHAYQNHVLKKYAKKQITDYFDISRSTISPSLQSDTDDFLWHEISLPSEETQDSKNEF